MNIAFVLLNIALWAVAQVTATKGIRTQLSSEVNNSRKLGGENMGGYITATTVTDYAVIDRDLADMRIELEKLSDEGFANALRIYEEGGHSMSYAAITKTKYEYASPTVINNGVEFTGKDSNGNVVVGTVYKTQQRSTIRLQYHTGEEGAYYDGCQVGALALVGKQNTEKCFAESGTVTATIYGDLQEFPYTYNPLTDTKNGRTLQMFSGLLPVKSITCVKCPFPDPKYAHKYYGTATYGDDWIQAAFNSGKTNFKTGNADFSIFNHAARSKAIKKAVVVMNTFMYVLHEFEDAVSDCESLDPERAVRNWDEGVALYVGSRETEKGPSDGLFLYHTADKECAHFKTCGTSGNAATGKSKVNYDLLELFNNGKVQLTRGKCAEAKKTKEKIADLMYIPLIQGTLHNAYQVQYQGGDEIDRAQGATIAAAVLPRVHAANNVTALKIYRNMGVGASFTSYEAVEDAFKSVYADLNIDCVQIGGFWDKSSGTYYKNAGPCMESKSQMRGGIIGAVCGGVGLTIILTVLYWFHRKPDMRDQSYM